MTTPQDLDGRFREAVGALAVPGRRRSATEPLRDGSALTGELALRLFDAQLASRHLDLAARWLGSFGEGFRGSASAGHEGNAAVAAALRRTDPAVLHHRSGAFYCFRAGQAAGDPGSGYPTPSANGDDGPPEPLTEAARDVLRGVVASARDPLTGGRHHVVGHPRLHIVPTASTLAAHLPRAVGIGLAVDRLRQLAEAVRTPAGSGAFAGPPTRRGSPPDPPPAQRRPGGRAGALPGPAGRWPGDAVVLCSFGDIAVDRADALTALHTAGWCDHRGIALPVLFVCEDDGPAEGGPAPAGWVAGNLRGRPGLAYTAADGCDAVQTYEAAVRAVDWVRRHRRPAVLHLSTVRLLAGPAADPAAVSPADCARDPLVATARALVDAGLADPDALVGRYDEIGWRIRQVAEEVVTEPKLAGAAEVLATVAPRRPLRAARAVADTAGRALGPGAAERAEAFADRPPERAGPLTLAQTLNATLADAMLALPGLVVFGADVASGGAHGVTRGLRGRFGAERVFDTVPDGTAILGLAAGAGLAGLLPVPEVRRLADLHGAAAQLRGEAAGLQFLSRGAFRNPMVVRVAGLAHHDDGAYDDNSLAALRDIPGLVLALPARAQDAAPMLRSCLASAATDGTVSVFVEPVALHHSRDLFADGDGQWLSPYPEPGAWAAGHVPIGRARSYGFGSAEDLTIITFGNGVPMSLRVATALADEGYGTRVVDLRWLAPLPAADLVREAAATGRVLVVDETRRSGGVGEGVIAALVDGGYVGSARRIAAVDSFVPPGPAADQVLIGEDAITQGARGLLAG